MKRFLQSLSFFALFLLCTQSFFASDPFFRLEALPEERLVSSVLSGKWIFYEREEKAVIDCLSNGAMTLSLCATDKRIIYAGTYICNSGILEFSVLACTEIKDSMQTTEWMSEKWHIAYAILEGGEMSVESADIPKGYIKHNFSRPTSFRKN